VSVISELHGLGPEGDGAQPLGHGGKPRAAPALGKEICNRQEGGHRQPLALACDSGDFGRAAQALMDGKLKIGAATTPWTGSSKGMLT